MKNILKAVGVAAIIAASPISALGAEFQDIPPEHYAYDAVVSLSEAGIVEGLDEQQFGRGIPMTQGELSDWIAGLTGSTKQNFTEAGFDPDAPATREQAAVMMIKAAGFAELSEKVSGWNNAFQDVENNKGYINMAKDFGIMSGIGNDKFSPDTVILREQAATAVFGLSKRLDTKIKELNGFYAIQSSSQKDLIPELDTVSYGWSRVEYDATNKEIILNTIKSANNEYGVPEGFSEVVGIAEKSGAKGLLMITAAEHTVEGVPLAQYVISTPELRAELIGDIKTRLNGIVRGGAKATFDGAVVDLENLKGETNKKNLNAFVTELRDALGKDSLIYVAVHPARRAPLQYYDAYDFRALGTQADRIILMAHDYYARILSTYEMQSGYTTTPLAPGDEVYYALRAITDPVTGVADKNKIMLQISFDAAQWKLKDGQVINSAPYRPDYAAIYARLKQGGIRTYSLPLESPYLEFHSAEDGTDNIIWYEDTDSVSAKIKLASMFGVNKISLWRLGTIPSQPEMNGTFDVWGLVKGLRGR